MKTKEELDALKEKTETMNNTLAELTDDELETVLGGLIGNGGQTLLSTDGLGSYVASQFTSLKTRGGEPMNTLFTDKIIKIS